MNQPIVLGLNNCVDYELVWHSSVLEDLVRQYDIRADELTPDAEINNERDLVVSILGFFQTGTGGERAVASHEILMRFAERFDYRVTLGGTGVRAAIAMRGLGGICAVHLTTVNDHVRRLLPDGCSYICSAEKDSMYPHTIVQYREGMCIRAGDIDLTARRDNRIIYLDDPVSVNLAVSEELGDLLKDAKVVLLSGFNSLRDRVLAARRLDDLLRHMKRLPPDATVFFEDGACKYPDVNRLIRETLCPIVDIASFNEDEMQKYLSRKVDLLDERQVLRALDDMRALISAPLLLAHTRYWALVYGENASRYMDALRGGVAMATTRFRFGDDLSPAHYRDTLSLPYEREGTEFAARVHALSGDRSCCVSSLAVNQANATTIGLGDAFVGGFIHTLWRGI